MLTVSEPDTERPVSPGTAHIPLPILDQGPISITSLVAKLNKIPFESIGNELHQTLSDADGLLKTLNTQVAPEACATLVAAQQALASANSTLQPNSALAQSTVDTMRELSRTAASFRALADYLERHPEALLRGKTEDKK